VAEGVSFTAISVRRLGVKAIHPPEEDSMMNPKTMIALGRTVERDLRPERRLILRPTLRRNGKGLA